MGMCEDSKCGRLCMNAAKEQLVEAQKAWVPYTVRTLDKVLLYGPRVFTRNEKQHSRRGHG